MPMVSTGDVRPGKCFTARADGRVRRVQAVNKGAVTYEVRSHKGPRTSGSRGSEMPVSDFVAEVDREVGCDFIGDSVG